MYKRVNKRRTPCADSELTQERTGGKEVNGKTNGDKQHSNKQSQQAKRRVAEPAEMPGA